VLPLLAVLAGYAILRAVAADVPPTGGRFGKLALFGMGLAVLALMARSHQEDGGPKTGPPYEPSSWLVPALAVAAVAVAAAMPATAPWVREKLTFVAFSAFHLATPIAQPPPPAFFVDPATPVYWGLGLMAVAAIAAIGWIGWPTVRRSPQLQYLIAFIAAALVPVSTMTGGARYLYLATVGTSLGGAWLAQSLPAPWRTAARVVVVGTLAIAPMQIVLAGRAWIWASEMAADAATTIRPHLAPCGGVDLVLLTAPVQIRGVYSNLNAEAFSTRGCAPASVRALTRVVRDDVPVVVTSRDASAIEWSIPDDRGNIVASEDLGSFDLPLRSPEPVVVATPLGRLESRVTGGARVFRFEPSAAERPRIFAYYGSGRVRLLPRTVQ
jgi:hypothetical protein